MLLLHPYYYLTSFALFDYIKMKEQAMDKKKAIEKADKDVSADSQKNDTDMTNQSNNKTVENNN